MQLYLRTLGTAGLYDDKEADAQLLIGPGKPLSVLIYLAVAPRRSATRERLIDLLWSEFDPDHARQTLRQTIWQLRRTLGAEALTSDRASVRLDLALTSDHQEFVSAVERGDESDAINSYGGPFLPDFAIPGAAGFEQWVDSVRRHLQLSFRSALETIARDHLAHGRSREALGAATRMRDDDPTGEDGWRLLLETRLVIGDVVRARDDANELERVLQELGRLGELLTRELLARVRGTQPIVERGTSGLSGDLVGREAQFARILNAWSQTASGRGSALQIIAPAGLGKTRLLRDIRRRVATGGARAVYSRAHPGEQNLPYAFVATVARELSVLPGAAGVSPTTASVLLALDPSLGSRYETTPDPSVGDEASRRRVLALVDLIEAVTENGPLALLLDDRHWADAQSESVIQGIAARAGDRALLLLTARRPIKAEMTDQREDARLDLPPLTHEQIGELLASIGPLSDAAWSDSLVANLHAASGGSPLLLIETLQLALDQGWLKRSGGEWTWASLTPIGEALTARSALDRRIQRLTGLERQTLLVIAIAGTPVKERILQRAVASADPALEALERLGLVRRQSDTWEIAHDEIADSALRVLKDDLPRLQLALGKGLASEAEDSTALKQAAQHLSRVAALGELVQLYKLWLDLAKQPNAGRSDRELAAELLGASGSQWERPLLTSRPILRRLGFRSRTPAIAAGAILLILTGYLVAPPGRGQAERLSLVVRPLAAQVGLTPPPVLEIQDKRGRRVVDAADTVRITLLSGGSGLRGTTLVGADSGRATFRDVSVDAITGWPIVRFSAAGLPSIVDTIKTTVSRLQILQGLLDGQQIDSQHTSVVVRPGSEIKGTLHLRYSATWGAAAVMLGAAPTWGDPRETFVTLGPLSTPALDAGREADIDLPGPARVGAYHLIVFFQAEPDVKWIASGTNWSYGHPVWTDGNDVAQWNSSQLAEARGLGGVTTTVLRPQGRLAQWVPAAVIDIVARP